MYLKKIYKNVSQSEEPVLVLDYISLGHTGTHQEQNFNVGLVTEMAQLGLLAINGNELTLRVHPEELRYTIQRTPGRYCLHCGEKVVGDDPGGEDARLHIALKHNGVASPDPNNQAGYEWIRYYECVLDAKQHAKYHFVPGKSVTFPRKDGSNG